MDNLLKDLPFILWINLDESKDRYNYMTNLFQEYNIKNNYRISAHNGIISNNFFIKNDKFNIKDGEYGCTCSHLKALEYYVNNLSHHPYIIIAEDDLSFDYLRYWKKSWNEYLNEMSSNFDLLMLTLNTPLLNEEIYNEIKFRKWIPKMYSTVCYMISLKSAKKILNLIPKIDNKYDFSIFKDRNYMLADSLLYYNLDKVYNYPLFTYNCSESIVNNERLKAHKHRKYLLENLWKL